MEFNVTAPELFDFNLALDYLGRSKMEVLHRVEHGSVIKLLDIDQNLLLTKISHFDNRNLQVQILAGCGDLVDREILVQYVENWFDLKTDLDAVYNVLNSDALLSPLINSHHGLRLVGIDDLFEAISWAIIGQQINLTFAYQVKKMLVEQCGHYLDYDSQRFYLFPSPSSVLSVPDEKLKEMKFSRQKIRYIKLAAEKILNGGWNKTSLASLSPHDLKKELISLLGIGEWSANYVMMRCFRVGSAYPMGDAGLHQALSRLMNLDRKPTKTELLECADKWHPWEAYATFYLWRSLAS
jgi:DNA-3-methyladenine glycosylase II